MSYDYQKDLKEVVNKDTNKYGSMEKAIFEMNGHIADLKAQVKGKQALLDLLYSAINKAKNSLESVKI